VRPGEPNSAAGVVVNHDHAADPKVLRRGAETATGSLHPLGSTIAIERTATGYAAVGWGRAAPVEVTPRTYVRIGSAGPGWPCGDEEDEVNGSEWAWSRLLDKAGELGPDPALADVSDADVEHLVRVGAAELAALTARWLKLVGELVVRDLWAGFASPGQWLSYAVGAGSSTAREYVRVALRLRELPAIRARFEAGTLSYSKVRALTRAAVPELEEMLLMWADSATAATIERVISSWRTCADAGPAKAVAERSWTRVQRDEDTVEFRLRMPTADALAVQEAVDRLVEFADHDRDGHDADDGDHDGDIEGGGGGDRGDGDGGGGEKGLADGDVVVVPLARQREPLTARRLDAAVQALVAAATCGPADTTGLSRHLLVVHVAADDLAAATRATDEPAADGCTAADPPATAWAARGDTAPATDPAPTPAASAEAHGTAASVTVLDSHGAPPPATGHVARSPRLTAASAEAPRRGRVPVVTGRGRQASLSPSALARLSCDATFQALLTGTAGAPLDVGRRVRDATARQRRALHLRDRHCRFPGCRATRHLHAHHVVPWTDGGPTDLANLLTLCSHHHRLVHDAGWRLAAVDPATGRWHFHPPDDHSLGAPLPPARPLPGASAETARRRLVDDLGRSPDASSLHPSLMVDTYYDLHEAVAALVRELERVTETHPAAA
jgi:hypothetical protein